MTPRPDTSPACLLPAWSVERFPKPVRDAQAKATDILAALGPARERVHDARRAAREASDVDAEALATATREGRKPPNPTVATREHEKRAAEDAYELLSKDYETAVKALPHRTLIEHLPKAMEAQHKALAAAAEDADPNAYLEKVETLGRERALLNTLAGIDKHKHHHRRGKLYERVGKVHFDNPPSLPEGMDMYQVTGDLGFAVQYLAEPVAETVGQRQEREAREAEEFRKGTSGLRQMAKGGAVHVPSA